MKVKALRYKEEFNKFKEFVHIEDIGAGPEVFTSDLPKLQPETVTLEVMKTMMEENDYYEGLELDWDNVELVEFELVEKNTIGADIRNKLSPILTLSDLINIYFKEKDEEKGEKLVRFIKEENAKVIRIIKYLSDLL